MLYDRFPRVAFKFIRFKVQRAHPLTLVLAGAGLIAMTVLVTFQITRADEKPATSNTRHDFKYVFRYR